MKLDAHVHTHYSGMTTIWPLSHTGRGIGRSYTVVDDATSRDEFMTGLRAGRARAEGQQGSYFTMASDMLRFAGRFYEERTIRHDLRRLPALLLGLVSLARPGHEESH